MTWINLENIPLIQFRKGYKPPEYHDKIVYSRDAKFMYPRVIEPLARNFQKKEDLINFYNMYDYRFNLKESVADIVPYSYMPGPGEIRPTHVVLRYDIKSEKDSMSFPPNNEMMDSISQNYSESVVLKIVNSKYGYQEYRKQQRLYELGFPTPETFYYCNYFTDVQDILSESKNIILQPEIEWFLEFTREIELNERFFNELKKKENNERMRNLVINEMKVTNGQERLLLERFLDDLNNLGEGLFDGLEFKGFFFMDYLENSLSFEFILFDLLGGKELERASGAEQILPYRPDLNKKHIIKGLISRISEMWELVSHNDFKGEHLLYDYKNDEWFVIDWGELVGGSKGKDLAVLLADTNAFIQDRIKFNKMYGRKISASQEHLGNIGNQILKRNDRFWKDFLQELSLLVDETIFEDAYEILKKRRLSFDAEIVKRFF
mgnify:CR=1 FL=1